MKPYAPILILLLLLGCKKPGQRVQIHERGAAVVGLPNPSSVNSSLPRLYKGGQNLYLSWVSKKDTLNYLQVNRFDGVEWLHTDTLLSGTDWFVNWADFPQICENNDYLLSSYLKKSASGTYTYDIRLNHFNPKSAEWKRDYRLNTDGTESEHGFVSMQPYGENGFFVSWLDGRNTSGEHEHSHSGAGAMTLRGAFIDSLGTVYQETELDSRVCDCCNTASTVTADGILVAYRNRTESEIRDISVIRYGDGNWKEPIVLGNDQWEIAGCPVNGPGIDSFGNATAVAWFSGAKETPKVQIAFSEDGGRSFGLPIRVDSGNAIGRVDIVMLSKSEAAVSWMEPEGEETVIRVRKISSSGTLGMPITLSKTAIERASGFPQMEVFYSRLYFAWTHIDNGKSEIRTASVSLESL